MIWTNVVEFGSNLWFQGSAIFWFFILSVLVSAGMNVLRLDRKVARFFERAGGAWSIVGALLLGLVSPLWALGVLPVVAGLMASGVPLVPVMVFLITSPLVSPTAFIITLGGLGPALALGKLFSAVVLGLAAGWVTHHLVRQGYLGRHVMKVDELKETTCQSSPGETPPRGAVFRAFMKSAYLMTRQIGKYLILALVIQVLLMRYVPAGWIQDILGRNHVWSVALSSILGVPLYVNGISAVPVLQGLLKLGMDPGAILAFLVSGPMMSVPSIVAVMALLRRQAIYVYVSVGLLGAMVMGYGYQLGELM